jgi:predicted SnoaL-like aldol condensation-catalyzing enzyme
MTTSQQAHGVPVRVREANKQVVLGFYEAAFNDKNVDAALRFVGAPYVQHNPVIADGLDGLKARLNDLAAAFPDLRVEVKRLVAEGDQVVAHVHAVRATGQRDLAIVDIFRLEEGRLVEHWDVMQEVPEDSLNHNGMF